MTIVAQHVASVVFAYLSAFALATTVSPHSVQSQAPAGKGVFTGSVVDSLRTPVSEAEILIPEIGRTTMSDSVGVFRMTDLPNGTFRVVVRKLGFAASTLRMEHSGDGEINVTVVLARSVTQLAADTVAGKSTGIDRFRTEFVRRAEFAAKTGFGGFVTRAELAKREHSTTINILRTKLKGFEFVPMCGRGYGVASRSAGASFELNPRMIQRGGCGIRLKCFAQVFLDGMRIYSVEMNPRELPPDLDRFSPNTLEGIEVYPSAAQTPAELNATGSACGTIVLWTRLR